MERICTRCKSQFDTRVKVQEKCGRCLRKLSIKRYRARNRAAGKCITCGKPRKAGHLRFCEAHAARASDKFVRKWHEKRPESGYYSKDLPRRIIPQPEVMR